MTCEGFVHQPGGCSSVKLLGFTCFIKIFYLKVCVHKPISVITYKVAIIGGNFMTFY